MLALSLACLLLAGCPAIAADAPPDQQVWNFVDPGLFSPSVFDPFSIQPAANISHPGRSSLVARVPTPCTEVPGSCGEEAICCDNGSCAGAGDTCCSTGICSNDAVCCDNGHCAAPGETCCSIGVCGVGAGCCVDISCVGDSSACCSDGSHCPAGYGCFEYVGSNSIFCSPTGGGSAPATSTTPPEPTTSSLSEPTTSSLSEPTSIVPGPPSLYYTTYQYVWTTYYYIYEIETYTSYIVTTVFTAEATDSAAAASSFNLIEETFIPSAPATAASLPGAPTPSPSPSPGADSTGLHAGGDGGATSTAGSGSNTGAAASGKITRGETLGMMCTVGAAAMIIMLIL